MHRIVQLNTHLYNNPQTSMAQSETHESIFSGVQLAPPDPIFNLSSLYKNDQNSEKIDLSVGAYRTNYNKPWILPVVYKAQQHILSRQLTNTQQTLHKPEEDSNTEDHEYLGIDGLAPFNLLSAKLLFGDNSEIFKTNRFATVQTISGTGANSLFASFMKTYYKKSKTILLSKPTWGNHKNIFSYYDLEIVEYPYFNSKTNMLDLENMISCFKKAPRGSIVLLHACAHNPTGVDPTKEEWKEIAKVLKENELFPFFDCAYQGFATGDVDKDAFALRYFVEEGFEMFVAQSYSKNFGLYGQRCGTLTGVFKNEQSAERVKSQLKRLSRATYSNPPKYGALIVKNILENDNSRKEWYECLQIMSGRIKEMRQRLYEELRNLQTPGNWEHIVKQIGMFTFTGLSRSQSLALKEKHHVYLTENGRISMAGLNDANVERFAKCMDDVVRNVQQ